MYKNSVNASGGYLQLGVNSIRPRSVNGLKLDFRFYAFGIMLSLQCTEAFSVETDWVRIGQVQNFIVDVNELSLNNNDGVVNAVARLIPRSSAIDRRAMLIKPVVIDLKPIFFTLSQARYECDKNEVLDVKETSFDTNISVIKEEARGGFVSTPEQYDLIKNYVCNKVGLKN